MTKRTYKIGDTDEMGHYVGYISPNGDAYESEDEYILNSIFGPWEDAWQQWNLWGEGDEPSFLDAADELPPHLRPKFEERIRSFFVFWVPFVANYQRQRAIAGGTTREEFLMKEHNRAERPKFLGEKG